MHYWEEQEEEEEEEEQEEEQEEQEEEEGKGVHTAKEDVASIWLVKLPLKCQGAAACLALPHLVEGLGFRRNVKVPLHALPSRNWFRVHGLGLKGLVDVWRRAKVVPR